MTDDPVELDGRRGIAAQRATVLRRQHLARFEADQMALQIQQEKLEELLLAAPAETWPDVAASAIYLLQFLANTPVALDDRRKRLIALTIEDLARLSDLGEHSE